MRRVSLKRQRAARALAPVLDAYRAEFPTCQVAGCKNTASELHEIARGQNRWRARHERACLLHLCSSCHRDIYGRFPPSIYFQLAWKKLSNSGYDLATVLRVKGWDEGAITEVEVDLVARGLRKERVYG